MKARQCLPAVLALACATWAGAWRPREMPRAAGEIVVLYHAGDRGLTEPGKAQAPGIDGAASGRPVSLRALDGEYGLVESRPVVDAPARARLGTGLVDIAKSRGASDLPAPGFRLRERRAALDRLERLAVLRFKSDAPVEEIARAGVMAAFHVGADAFEQTHPFRLAKIARRHPEMTILAVHMCGVGHRDLTAAMIEVALECPNIHLIGSAVRATAVLRAVRRLGAERVCFGSDTPFALMHVELAKYRALLTDEVSPGEMDLVLGGNMVRLLGLDAR